ncbi:glycosyl transferase [Pedobacter deserti]|uniref:glycosyl transferase n=1 Tax=Pedobacter deserti TaxID=2817382 RepID=UPI00210B3FC7|nr:glycosyl transferase [Pedobacter sp. SYSU D00382]
MLNFCTLFNSTYLSRGLAMYQSLEEHCSSFHLYVIAFDDHCYEVLSRLGLVHATVVSLNAFENERLLSVKNDRTAGEYCWTCASSTIKYCLQTYALDHCTYVDADLMFFSDPQVLLNEMGDKSVLITPHRYTPKYDQTAMSGVYCVQFMTFKSTPEGMEVLDEWVNKCIEWCYSRCEDGKFGDQKYLDDWQQKFSTVHVLKHLGGGVAPWNVQQYKLSIRDGRLRGKEIASGNTFDLIFYHYHGFQYTAKDIYSLSGSCYTLLRNAVKYVYRPYIRQLNKAERVARLINRNVNAHEITDDLQWIKSVPGRALVFFLRGYYKNLYKKNALTYGFLN